MVINALSIDIYELVRYWYKLCPVSIQCEDKSHGFYVTFMLNDAQKT